MRSGKVLIKLDRSAVHRSSLDDRLSSAAREQSTRPKPALIRLHIAGTVSAQPLLLTLCQRHRQRADNLLYHLILDLEDIRQIAIKTSSV